VSGNAGTLKVPFCRPDVTEAEIAEVTDTLRSGWITTGPKVKKFEEAFAHYTGAPWAIAVSSCTAALHISLIAAGCRPGDEVITSVNTFTATAAAILHAGARPRLVDIEEDTMNMDPAAVEASLSTNTRAIVPVHLAGHPCELDRIAEAARSRGARVIEDAAHALPAAYRGKRIGAISDLTCFSFYATKNLTTGEGGMITGLDGEIGERLKVIGYHGMSKDGWGRYTEHGSWYYEIVSDGYKYNLADVAAAMGLRQLERLESMQARRREVVAAYDDAFKDMDSLVLPVTREGMEHAWHLYIVRLRPGALRVDRAGFIAALAAKGIGTSVHFIPLYHHPFYRDELGIDARDFPVAEKVYEGAVSLPLFSAMRDDEVERVVEAVREVVRENAR